MTETPPQTAEPPAQPSWGSAGVELLRTRLTRASGSLRALGTLLALGLIWLFFALESQYFFTTSNIWNILLQAANIGIIAAGLATAATASAWPDVAVGIGILLINLDASRQVYAAARNERRNAVAEP